MRIKTQRRGDVTSAFPRDPRTFPVARHIAQLLQPAQRVQTGVCEALAVGRPLHQSYPASRHQAVGVEEHSRSGGYQAERELGYGARVAWEIEWMGCGGLVRSGGWVGGGFAWVVG